MGYTLVIMVLLFWYRNSPQVRITSYRFSLISCAGAIVCFGGVFVLYPVPSDLTCALRPWVSDVGFVTLYGPIFAKTYRIDKLFNNRRKLKRKVISDRYVLRIVVALLVVVGVFLGVFMAVDRPRMDEAFTTKGERYEVCANKWATFVYIDYGMKALVLLWGCFLCQRVYKISGHFARFNESKQLVGWIDHTIFLVVCALLVNVTTPDDPNLFFVCFSAQVVMNTLVVVSVLYGRRVVLAVQGQPLDESDDTIKSNNTSPADSLSNETPTRSTGHAPSSASSATKAIAIRVPRVAPTPDGRRVTSAVVPSGPHWRKASEARDDRAST